MAGGGSSGVQRIEPPSYQLPYLQTGLMNAQTLYNQGNPVAEFGDASRQAQQMMQNRATQGDPTIAEAGNYVRKTLNGGFLNSNPFLDATFNKAAMATQGQLASQFAGARRNVDQSQGNRAQQLNDLATSIYGGNYANERNLMQGALGYAQPLGNQAYADAQALSGVGAQIDTKYQQKLDASGTALDKYLARVRGTDYGSTQTSSGKGNPVAGGIGGAIAGSQFGPWGSLFGGGLGAIFG